MISLLLLGCLPFNAAAAVTGSEVMYSAGGVEMKGYLAFDDAVQGKRPGILVVHEWWGHNEYARKRARQLAGMGYTALAVDMYGDGRQADHPEDAQKFAMAVMSDLDAASVRFDAAMEVLKKHPSTDPGKIAAIGYCFGGGVVLNMARMGKDLDGVASFHGSLAALTPAAKGKVKAKFLVCNGADDQFTTAEQIESFKKEMSDAGVDLRFMTYEGAKHSFTNPDADSVAEKFGLPLGYSEAADKKSWQDLDRFLKDIFAG
jgi:dienelactone hydrolase